MIHVEFMGIPGSGKTTLQQELLSLLKDRGEPAFDAEQAYYESIRREISGVPSKILGLIPHYPVRKNILRGYGSLMNLNCKAYTRFLVENPELASIVFSTINEQKLNRPPEKTAWYFYRLFSQYMYSKNHLSSGEYFIIDEGFCNRANTLFASHTSLASSSTISTYATVIPQPDIVYYIKSDLNVCLDRLRNRHGGFPSRIQEHSDVDKIDYLSNHQQCIEEMLRILKKSGCTICKVENSNSIDAAVEKIEFLLNI